MPESRSRRISPASGPVARADTRTPWWGRSTTAMGSPAHQARFADFEHGADPAGGVEADVKIVDTDAHGEVLARGTGHPHLEQDPADTPLLSDDRAADVEALGAEVLPEQSGGIVRPSCVAHQLASSVAYAYTTLSEPPWWGSS
jgi:hypothetical protein